MIKFPTMNRWATISNVPMGHERGNPPPVRSHGIVGHDEPHRGGGRVLEHPLGEKVVFLNIGNHFVRFSKPDVVPANPSHRLETFGKLFNSAILPWVDRHRWHGTVAVVDDPPATVNRLMQAFVGIKGGVEWWRIFRMEWAPAQAQRVGLCGIHIVVNRQDSGVPGLFGEGTRGGIGIVVARNAEHRHGHLQGVLKNLAALDDFVVRVRHRNPCVGHAVTRNTPPLGTQLMNLRL